MKQGGQYQPLYRCRIRQTQPEQGGNRNHAGPDGHHCDTQEAIPTKFNHCIPGCMKKSSKQNSNKQRGGHGVTRFIQ